MGVNKQLRWDLGVLNTVLDGCCGFSKIDYNSQDEYADAHEESLHSLVCHHHSLVSQNGGDIRSDIIGTDEAEL